MATLGGVLHINNINYLWFGNAMAAKDNRSSTIGSIKLYFAHFIGKYFGD